MDQLSTPMRPRRRWMLWTIFILSTIFFVVAVALLILVKALPGGSAGPADPSNGEVSWPVIATVCASFVTSLATFVGIVTGWRKQKLDNMHSELDLQKMELDLERSRIEIEQLKSGHKA